MFTLDDFGVRIVGMALIHGFCQMLEQIDPSARTSTRIRRNGNWVFPVPTCITPRDLRDGDNMHIDKKHRVVKIFVRNYACLHKYRNSCDCGTHIEIESVNVFVRQPLDKMFANAHAMSNLEDFRLKIVFQTPRPWECEAQRIYSRPFSGQLLECCLCIPVPKSISPEDLYYGDAMCVLEDHSAVQKFIEEYICMPDYQKSCDCRTHLNIISVNVVIRLPLSKMFTEAYDNAYAKDAVKIQHKRKLSAWD